MKTHTLLSILIMILFTLSCTNYSEDDLIADEPVSGEPTDPDDPVNTTFVTFDQDVQPIISSACVRCHASTPRNGASSSLVTYQQVNQRASNILSRMSRQSGGGGAMPPSGRLPQASIDVVMQWIEDGKLEN
ncbi:MAG: hypothetical protein WBG46_08360 [Nonlabens sp.]